VTGPTKELGFWATKSLTTQLLVGRIEVASLEDTESCLAGLLFLVKRTSNTANTALFLQSSDPGGLERVLRLFPIRTGVLVPDWLVVDERVDRIGAGGAEGAG
jgi:hypothetical protein